MQRSIKFRAWDKPKKFWMVWVNDTPTTKRRHPRIKEARREADRIASLPENIAKKVYVLEAIDYRYIELIPLVTVKKL